MAPAPRPLVQLRKLCLALPEAHEVLSHGEPTFRLKNKMFATYANANNHHGRGRHAVWIKAASGRQARAVKTAPDRFFVPPYVGPSGWVGVYLDATTDWKELQDILRDAYKLVAPTTSNSCEVRLKPDTTYDGDPPLTPAAFSDILKPSWLRTTPRARPFGP